MAEGSANIWGMQLSGTDRATRPFVYTFFGSRGDGRFGGGLGQALAFRVLSDELATCSVLCDRTTVPAQGFFGGLPGAAGQALINGAAPTNPKAEQTLHPGDLIEILMPGGSGYGRPRPRLLQLVPTSITPP